MEEILSGIASALQIDATEFTESLKADGKLLEGDALVAKVVSEIRETIKTAKDDQHARGLRSSTEKLQKWMKAKGFAAPADLKGEALMDAYNVWKDEQSTPEPGDNPKTPAEMTEPELEKLPAFKSLLAKKLQPYVAEVEAKTQEFESFKKGIEGKTVVEKTQEYIASLLESKGAVLEVPALKVTKAQRLENFYKLVDFKSIRLNDKGVPYLVDENGDELKSDIGKPVSFDEHVLNINKATYGFQTVDSSKKSPSPGQGDQGQGSQATTTFASIAEAEKIASTSADAAMRSKAITWLAEQQTAT